MIAHLTGSIISREPGKIVLDVSGVGYMVNVPLSTYAELEGEKGASLHVYTHVREDALSLYGFKNTGEKALFEKLISISGIGPSLALNIISGVSAEELIKCVREKNSVTLKAVPGVGKKTAERIILEMESKLKNLDVGAELGAEASPDAGVPELVEDVYSALTNLGYKSAAASKALRKVINEEGADRDFQVLLRKALKVLAP